MLQLLHHLFPVDGHNYWQQIVIFIVASSIRLSDCLLCCQINQCWIMIRQWKIQGPAQVCLQLHRLRPIMCQPPLTLWHMACMWQKMASSVLVAIPSDREFTPAIRLASGCFVHVQVTMLRCISCHFTVVHMVAHGCCRPHKLHQQKFARLMQSGDDVRLHGVDVASHDHDGLHGQGASWALTSTAAM